MKAIYKRFIELKKLMNLKDRRFLNVFVLLTCSLALLDLVALALLALSINPVLSNESSKLPIIGELPAASLPLLLAISLSLLLLRNLGSLVSYRIAVFRVSSIEMSLGSYIFEKNLRLPWAMRSQKSSMEIVRTSDYSVSRSTGTFLLPAILIPSILSSVVAIGLTLIVLEPLSALVTILYFLLVAVFLQRWLSPRSHLAGQIEQKNRNFMTSAMLEMLNASKELILRGKINSAVDAISLWRAEASRSNALFYFYSNLSRPIFEVVLLLGALAIGLLSYLTAGLEQTLSAIAIFVVAGFRLAPAFASLQTNIHSANVAIPFVDNVVSEFTSTSQISSVSEIQNLPSLSEESLCFSEVSYSYPGKRANKVIDSITMNIPLGKKVAFVGPSGSGKSTILDLILGLLTPDSGEISIAGESLENILTQWQRSIGYVPQTVTMFDGTIAANVALDWQNEYDIQDVEKALARAQLIDFVRSLPDGINTKIGESGHSLSGGQRQRLGIARALYSNPKILILDEATSALDNNTEREISRVLDSMDSSLTIISIAHRLSTIKKYDLIHYVEAGNVICSGTYEDLIKQNRNFALQAEAH